MEKLQLIAMVQAYSGIGIGLMIGLGALGAPVAGLLLKAGHAVAVYDVRSEPVAELRMLGARACASPAEVAQHSDIVISLVSDRAQTEDIVFGGNGMFDQDRKSTRLNSSH